MRARDNPFRSECVVRVPYRLQDFTWPEFLQRCAALGYRGAVVGPHGSGKTTLLENLQEKLRKQGFETRFLRLDAECPRFAPGWGRQFVGLTWRHVVMLDGAEQLTPLSWHWFKFCARRAAGLIITVHQPGRLPTLWECRTSPPLLAEIAGELLARAPDTVQEVADTLFRRSRGNLREALRAWYDLQAGEGGVKVTPSRIGEPVHPDR